MKTMFTSRVLFGVAILVALAISSGACWKWGG